MRTETAQSRKAMRTDSLKPAQRGQRYGQILQSSFRPHPLLPGAHLQTIATLLRPAPRLVLRRERLELTDGDFVDLGWSGDHNAGGPLAARALRSHALDRLECDRSIAFDVNTRSS
jgi:hypothetical protein